MQATHNYHKLLQYILQNGTKKADRTGTGTITVPSYHMEFDMQMGFPLITTKKLHTPSIIHELLWFLRGDTNVQYLQENGVRIWNEWADEHGDLGPVYGKQWVNWEKYEGPINVIENGSGYLIDSCENIKSINQIQNALDKLRNNPEDRGNIVSAWNVGELDKMALRPCHWAFQLITEELTLDERKELYRDKQPGNNMKSEVDNWDYKHDFFDNQNIPKYRLHLKWHQRSVDTFLGLPFNIASYALLLRMFAQQANMVPGTLYGDLSEVHIYDNHIDYVKEQLERDMFKYNAPKLELTKTDSIFDYTIDDIKITDYKAFPNWKKPPIAV